MKVYYAVFWDDLDTPLAMSDGLEKLHKVFAENFGQLLNKILFGIIEIQNQEHIDYVMGCLDDNGVSFADPKDLWSIWDSQKFAKESTQRN